MEKYTENVHQKLVREPFLILTQNRHCVQEIFLKRLDIFNKDY